MAYYGMSDSEYARYTDWRKKHPCTGTSQVEIIIIPDAVQDLIQVHCFKCDEVYQVSSFDEA